MNLPVQVAKVDVPELQSDAINIDSYEVNLSIIPSPMAPSKGPRAFWIKIENDSYPGKG